MFNLIRKLLARSYHPLNTIEISKKNLISNYRYLSSINPKIKIAPVLKSNSYGHGIVEVAKILETKKPTFFCVDSLFEAYQLQKANIKTPILIMGYTNPENLKVKELPFAYAVSDLKTLQAINLYQPKASVHLFVDTGMNREGILLNQLPAFLTYLKRLPNIRVEGLMSHLATAEDPKNPSNKEQINNFSHVQRIVRKAGFKPKWIHLFATKSYMHQKSFSSKLHLKGVKLNMARIGIGLFGIDPLNRLNRPRRSQARGLRGLNLKPVLSLKTKIAEIKRIKKGSLIGYSGTYKTKNDLLIGILPIGYFDGVDRRLSNQGFVKIDRVFCPIIGIVSMNITTIDISDVPNPKIGQEVVVFSDNPNDLNSIQQSAKLCKTIPYEILIHLTSSTKRNIV